MGLVLWTQRGSLGLLGLEGDPQLGPAWGQTFTASALWVSLGYCWDRAGGSKGFFEIDQQETH